jgi:hypothetical protein
MTSKNEQIQEHPPVPSVLNWSPLLLHSPAITMSRDADHPFAVLMSDAVMTVLTPS